MRRGVYSTQEMMEKILENPDFGIELLKKLKQERLENKKLKEKLSELIPNAGRCDNILSSPVAVPVTLIAKEYGMSAVRFNALLHELGVQYSVGGTWVLYQSYAGKGYIHTNTMFTKGRHIKLQTLWTQKGSRFLYDLLKEYGYYPINEADNYEA